MNVLISGGSGLIGSAISHHLYNLGNDAVVYDYKDNGMNFYNAEEPLSYHLNLPIHQFEKFKFKAFIDCAMYKKPSEQRAVWDTVIDHFKQQQGGKIILLSSIYGHKAPDFSIYEGTEIAPVPLEYAIWKGGVEQATRYLAQRLKPWGIQVNAIAPGGVCDKHSTTFQNMYLASGDARMIQTKNILPVVDMLLHPDNAVNGQVITVDGGWCL